MMTPHEFRAGQLDPAAAAALTEMSRLLGGLSRMEARPPLSVVRQGFTGQPLLFLDPQAIPDGIDKAVTDVCLVPDAYGAVVGIALFYEYADGRGRCVVRGFCEDCAEADVPPSPPAPCVTVSGTVKLQPEDAGTYTGLYLTAYGAFFSAVTTGAYTLDLTFSGAGLGFTCDVPPAEAPRSVYYSTDAGASWTLATDIGLPSDGFMFDLPATCEPAEVLWELWADGYEPAVINPPVGEEEPPPP